jgi:RNA polymerase sigma-70 factor, ECF subfamily
VRTSWRQRCEPIGEALRPTRVDDRGEAPDELVAWLAEDYARAYRTACLVLRDADEAEDAVQDAFLRVWRFRDAVPQGEGRRAWLYRVVVNACVSAIRARQSRTRLDDGDLGLEGVVDPAPGPGAAAERSALAGTVLDALAELPEHLRVPVVLRYWTGLSEKEIAVAIDRRPGTVKSRLHDARQRLAADPRLSAWARDDDEAALEAVR